MHRHLFALLTAAALTLSLATADARAQGSQADPIRDTLAQAREAGTRSVTLHVQGQTVALLVTAVEAQHVIGRSAQHDRIVVRLDRIDAVSF